MKYIASNPTGSWAKYVPLLIQQDRCRSMKKF